MAAKQSAWSGKDGPLIYAKKLHLSRKDPELDAPEIIDLGHVGEVTRVNKKVWDVLAHGDFVPVVAPMVWAMTDLPITSTRIP